MELRSNQNHGQSLNVTMSCDQPTQKEAGLRDTINSVSQLVSRYQSTVAVRTSTQEILVNDSQSKPKQSKESHLESLMWRNEERERSRVKTNLVRSKSMGSLQNGTGSIEVLKALFESKPAASKNVKSSFRAANMQSFNKAADLTQAINGDAEEVKRPEEKSKVQIPAGASVNDENYHHLSQKVVKQTRLERRRTIGGVDFEQITASQAEEKRRSFADFRGSSFIQTKEKLCVSVKAISALYLSKVAPQEPTNNLLKQAKDQSSESGKTAKPIKCLQTLTAIIMIYKGLIIKVLLCSGKMADDSKQRKGQSMSEDTSGAYVQPPIQSQVSREMLYKQRQKCELRRLLKHTHPELKTLDDVVDEEFAEVLSPEHDVTTGETGYEGEVLSRCLIFENSKKGSPCIAQRHVAKGTVEGGNVSITNAVYQEKEKRLCPESGREFMDDAKTLDSTQVPQSDCEREMMRNVQVTRELYESRPVNACSQHPKTKLQGNISLSGNGMEADQNQNQEFREESCQIENKNNLNVKSLDLTNLAHKQGSCVHIPDRSPDDEYSGREVFLNHETDFGLEATCLPNPENPGKMIKTRVDLLQNNPFIPTNIDREQSFEHTSKSPNSENNSPTAQDPLKANVKNRAYLFESMPFDKIKHQNKDDVETMVENMKETLHCLHRINAIHSGGSIIEVNETMIAKKALFTLSEDGPMIKYEEVAEGGAQNFILHLLPRANLNPHITYLKEDSGGAMKATVLNIPVQQHQYSMNQDKEFKTANVIQVIEDILNQDNSLRKGVIIQEGIDKCAEVLVYSLYQYFDDEDVKSYYPPQNTVYDEPEPKRDDVSKTDSQEVRKGVVGSTISCLLDTTKDQIYQESMRPVKIVKGNVKMFKSCIEKGDLEYLKNLHAEPAEEEQLIPQESVSGKHFELHHEPKDDQTEESRTEWVPVDVKKLRNMFSGGQGSTTLKQNACKHLAQSTAIPFAIPNQNTQRVVQTQRDSCNSADVPQGSGLHLKTQDNDRVHKAEIVEAVDDSDEILNLQTAMHILRQVTNEANSLHHSSQEKHLLLNEESSHGHDVDMKLVMVSKQSSEVTDTQQKDEEVVFQGKLQAALNSLEKSNINVTRGDFRAAMIYKHSSKLHNERSQNVDVSVEKRTKEDFCPPIEHKSDQAIASQDVNVNADPPSQSEDLKKDRCTILKKEERPTGPKPAIPPKPAHLKVTHRDSQSTNAKNPELTQTDPIKHKKPAPPQSSLMTLEDEHKSDQLKIYSNTSTLPDSTDLERHHLVYEDIVTSHEREVRHRVPGSILTLEVDNTDKTMINHQLEINMSGDEKSPDDFSVIEDMNQKHGSLVDYRDKCQKLEGEKTFSAKNAPVKPKRANISQSNNKNTKYISGVNDSTTLTNVFEESDPHGQNTDSKEKTEIKPECKVEIRGKKGRIETENERRQRLSVHMDEIMRGNMTAAMKIFDNLQKHEELQRILSKVEEIEQDTSMVDVKSLRGVFENVPDWIINSDKKKQNKIKVENKGEVRPLMRDNTESKSSMAHVFGDLERASEEIMNLKEQTLARLLDIEGAIKKALYSVSTLKSDSDIDGLSHLLKESLGTVKAPLSPSPSSISKISIGSSRTQSVPTQESPALQETTALPVSRVGSFDVDTAKQTSIPHSSPSFISIQSAARKMTETEDLPPETKLCPTCQQNTKTQEKFWTTKDLTCNSPAQNRQSTYNQLSPKRELSVLDVETEGKSIKGTKTVTENYERTDNLGNRIYSSKTSTIINAQPTTPATSQPGVGSATDSQQVPRSSSPNQSKTLTQPSTASISLSRDVFGLSEASLFDGKNGGRQIHLS
ncbi:LIM domain-containing protein [Antennarius striatus]|uniref:LIM domain-containing protein n=1 Tax=Antennarius striatus TaxID=241820 RepID=UPI0035B07026